MSETAAASSNHEVRNSKYDKDSIQGQQFNLKILIGFIFISSIRQHFTCLSWVSVLMGRRGWFYRQKMGEESRRK
jgi:hypothetical protein